MLGHDAVARACKKIRHGDDSPENRAKNREQPRALRRIPWREMKIIIFFITFPDCVLDDIKLRSFLRTIRNDKMEGK